MRLTALVSGLVLYGLSMAMMVEAGLGLDPWDVLHQGMSHRMGITIGAACALAGVAVLAGWIPLRNKPGIGTVANVLVVAVAVDAGLALLPTPNTFPVRIPLMLAAVVLNGVATVVYVGAGLGPGPRDGLTTGLAGRTGWSVWSVRTLIESAVLLGGWLLGGTVGIGTLIYAFGIGPILQLLLKLTPDRVLVRSGWAGAVGPMSARAKSRRRRAVARKADG